MSQNIRAVAFRRGEWWIAQCLEFGIATQARRLEDLPYELNRLLKAQVAASLEVGVEPFQGFSPAPRKYWDMFENATSRLEPIRLALQEGPRFETRIAA